MFFCYVATDVVGRECDVCDMLGFNSQCVRSMACFITPALNWFVFLFVSADVRIDHTDSRILNIALSKQSAFSERHSHQNCTDTPPAITFMSAFCEHTYPNVHKQTIALEHGHYGTSCSVVDESVLVAAVFRNEEINKNKVFISTSLQRKLSLSVGSTQPLPKSTVRLELGWHGLNRLGMHPAVPVGTVGAIGWIWSQPATQPANRGGPTVTNIPMQSWGCTQPQLQVCEDPKPALAHT